MTDRAGIARRFTESVARPIAAADAAPTEQWVKGTVTGHDPLTVLAQGGSHQVEPIGYVPPIGTEVWVRFGAGQAPLALVAPPAPFAMAAGLASTTSDADGGYTATITLPAGRFTQAPIATLTVRDGAGANSNITARVTGTTTSAISIVVNSAAPSSTVPIGWIAVQMTADSAEG